MFELMDDSEGNVLGVRAHGKLTKDDYKRVLVPRLESTLERAEKIRVLFYMDETFQGWDLKAAWVNTSLDLRHRADFEKIAIVGASTWEKWCVKLASLLIIGEIETFKPDQLHDAWKWLRA